MATLKKNQVSVDTSSYYFSNWHEPKGRGSWAFGFTRFPDFKDVLWFTGTYAQARRQAVAAAAAAGQPTIFVLP
jgi:hypothetical protein